LTPYVPVGEILAGRHTGAAVQVRGWIHRTRSSGKLLFLVVRDGTGVVQATARKDTLIHR
jgi:asparaginyl-tRNA synthetase